ncbi:MAG: hypothetical protein M3Q65_18365 [Chloroflexota bacterium]|nr:hypothetical protein [Chloroflexota bacterium]
MGAAEGKERKGGAIRGVVLVGLAVALLLVLLLAVLLAVLLVRRPEPAPIVVQVAPTATPRPRPTPSPSPAPAALAEQERLANLVLAAIGDAVAGRPLPDELSPELQRYIREQVIRNQSPLWPARLTAFEPLPVAWQREAASAREDRAVLVTRLRGTKEITTDERPLRTARLDMEQAGNGIGVVVEQRGGRWVIAEILGGELVPYTGIAP